VSADAQQSPVQTTYRWIKLPLHCQITGDTSDAVHARRRKGQWRDGVQCQKGPDGNMYVNPEEWNKWVESNRENSACHAE
jgi:hypothetical protein